MHGLPATKDCILYNMIRFFEMSRAGKSRETEETLGVARGLRGLGKWRVTLTGMGVPSGVTTTF